jgi:enoyl-CoA hydratase/carnithine racemase
MAESANVVTQSVEGNVGVIELSRPEKFDCLSGAVAQTIDEAPDAFTAGSSRCRPLHVEPRATPRHRDSSA